MTTKTKYGINHIRQQLGIATISVKSSIFWNFEIALRRRQMSGGVKVQNCW